MLAPSEVFGRENLIDAIWQALAAQSVHLTAERRVGKTSVIKKMTSEKQPDLVCEYFDVEALSSPEELVEKIAQRLVPQFGVKERAKYGFFKVLAEFGGAEIKDIKIPSLRPHWKRLLGALIRDFIEDRDQLLVLCLDEFPWFIDQVERELKPPAAMEVLDGLRALRQETPRLRLVLTGSIGFHHILDRLRKHGYANQPLNDLRIIEVLPLDQASAERLAAGLLEGAAVKTATGVAAEIASITGGFPYFIHQCVSLAQEQGPIEPGGAALLLQTLFRDPHDRANFRHFRKRLADYYGKQADLASLILDAVARQHHSGRELLNIARHSSSDMNEAEFRDLLERLQQDHYLARNATDRFEFRYSIVARWWHFDRELP